MNGEKQFYGISSSDITIISKFFKSFDEIEIGLFV